MSKLLVDNEDYTIHRQDYGDYNLTLKVKRLFKFKHAACHMFYLDLRDKFPSCTPVWCLSINVDQKMGNNSDTVKKLRDFEKYIPTLFKADDIEKNIPLMFRTHKVDIKNPNSKAWCNDNKLFRIKLSSNHTGSFIQNDKIVNLNQLPGRFIADELLLTISTVKLGNGTMYYYYHLLTCQLQSDTGDDTGDDEL